MIGDSLTLLSNRTRQRILVLDDHPFVRTGITLSVTRENENVVVGEAANGDAGLEQIINLQPDLVILDLEMPGMPAAEVISRAIVAHPGVKFLVMSCEADGETLKKIKGRPIAGFLLVADEYRRS